VKLSIASILLLGSILAASATQSVTLAWDPSPEPEVVGYRLYWGGASRIYDGFLEVAAPTTQATIPGLEPGTTYFFAVTAFTDEGLESEYSAEVVYTTSGEPPDPLAALPPPGPIAISKEKGLVSWPLLGAYRDVLEVSTDLTTWGEACFDCPQRGGRYIFPVLFDQPALFYRLRRTRR